METTTIELKRSTWKALNQRKDPGDTMDDVVRDGLGLDGESASSDAGKQNYSGN